MSHLMSFWCSSTQNNPKFVMERTCGFVLKCIIPPKLPSEWENEHDDKP